MNVNKFGHHIHKRQKMRSSSLNNIFDAEYKIIKHIRAPVDPNDCATKEYVDNITNGFLKKFKTLDDLTALLNIEINSLKKNLDVAKQKINKK